MMIMLNLYCEIMNRVRYYFTTNVLAKIRKHGRRVCIKTNLESNLPHFVKHVQKWP